ncbi:MAG: hypothetical protein RL120_17445 [Gammaproteobacteria bacterium]
MKSIYRAILLSISFLLMIPSINVVAEEGYPHAYPRFGVRTLFENERVFAWDVTWIAGIEQPYHRHRYDLAAVYLRYGPIRVTQLDGSFNPPNEFEIPRPFFQPAGVTHKEEMIGFPEDAPERWAIMFYLKEVVKRPVQVERGTEAAFPRPGAELAIDNERVMEWAHGWEAGTAGAMRTYTRDSIQVITAPGTLQYTFPSGVTLTEVYAVGDTRFVPAGTVRAERAVIGSPRAVTLELK